ncbi:haloacid dehalogenase [Actinoplanes sp. NBRC 14428]|uniref:HAD family hydrolase n=1 Tax=Pseudosporangium ferrugineum TaxID=439699 RepID=UPI001BB66AF5|nr:HAD family hydrolase [Pseudosporangium ferrugineum]BCJ55310.1 haloacid dehalogenase [Actinoplanes sp. NBRC 14428]
MRLRGVLLDLDGTLVDHAAAADAGLRAWLPTIGLAATDAAVARWTELQEPHLAAWRAGTISFAEQRRRRLRDFLGTDAADPSLDETFAGYLRHYEAAWRAYDDVTDALEIIAAAGLATAVLTNGSRVQQHRKLARTGLAGRVGPVFTVDDLGVAKPDPRAYRLVCERWGHNASEVLSVGDDHELDVAGARAAGLHAAHLDRPGTGPADEAVRLTSLRDLGPLLAGGR